MASLSLPRVLQLKKNSLDAEREQFEKFQTLAIQKAINSIETPVKEKHVRSTIIGTFQEQSAVTYWMVAVRLPLQDNRIVAWKFCHVTHKLLREGHPACLDDSQRHIGMIENLGKLWVHLREGYGKLVHLYCSLLVCKLKFHARNPRFPGNMQLTADELDNIAENDVNNYFQLCVELFDYMDDILNLQAAVFDSLGNARANSMTASGQCRLAALIPCAQDSSHIYDTNVRLLFRLHAALPSDTLAGHRDRFRQQFKKLSSFYKHASSLQYYRNLLTLPVLPSNPPNFLQQSDFGTYVTPVVSIPEPPPDEVDSVGALIDTSDTMSQMTDQFEELDARPSPSPQPDPIVERDRLIDHLQNELKRMRGEVSQMVQERNTMLSSMREHCGRLEKQLQSTQRVSPPRTLRYPPEEGHRLWLKLSRNHFIPYHVELEEEKQKAEMLAIQTPEIKHKLTETEEKARITDEKFQKLKGAYTQLREEHITLIRQKAEVDKLTASLRAAAAQHESVKTQLQQQLNDKMKDVELLQQSASASEEIEAYKTEIANVRTELEQARQKEIELETVKASLESLQIEHNTAKAEQEDKINTIAIELRETSESLQKALQEKEETQTELAKVKEELVGLREKSGDEYRRVVEEKEMALKEIEQLKQEHQQEKEVLESKVAELNDINTSLQKQYDSYKNERENIINNLNHEITNLKSEFESTAATKDNEISTLKEDIENKQNEYQNEIAAKLELISNLEANVLEFKSEIEELKQLRDKDKQERDNLISEREKDKELMEARIDHVERKRLTAECELQDLLQHNSVLEADLNAVKKQLEEANRNLEQQSKKILSCASESAIEILSQALSALEKSNAQETNKLGAELAAQALEELATCPEVKGNEEKVAKSAICIAHNAAQLSAYVTEVSHISTDIEISEKLTNECRSMLSSTKECVESLSSPGSVQCTEARGRVRCMVQSAAAADLATTSGKSVDDELADMDTAIEQAAQQIEGMLAASRAADTGVQLEVNEKILDACTALMAAVKALVGDARSLQAELGDVTTRQNMYRKNPQWSEGLISAAKAVVFAAKLLVGAADEAVSGAGRLEGVAAGAQEVAGATAQLVAASRARAPPAAPALLRLAASSRHVPAAAGAVLAAVRAAAHTRNEKEALDTSSLTLTATRRLEMESKVRSLELEAALDAERARLAALRKHHYHLAQLEENGNVTNGKQ